MTRPHWIGEYEHVRDLADEERERWLQQLEDEAERPDMGGRERERGEGEF